ncbi:hypothetical protein HDU93_004329 [Gonapodya sp. JEL0774]|nr:hypothetical protein HDU93_004329 [Gonapodya sp. JEL0774]
MAASCARLSAFGAQSLLHSISSPSLSSLSTGALRGYPLATNLIGASRTIASTPSTANSYSSTTNGSRGFSQPSPTLPYEPLESSSQGKSITAELFGTPLKALSSTPSVAPTLSRGSSRSTLEALLNETRDPTSGLIDPRNSYSPPHVVTVTARRGNTIVSVSDSAGRTLCVRSAGKVGFKKANRGTPDAAYAVCLDIVEKLSDVPMTGGVALRLSGFGPGRDQSARAFRAAGWRLVRVEDVTPDDALNFFDPFKEASEMKVLLLENINEKGVEVLRQAGFRIETEKKSLTEEELIARIPTVHVLGIRSKTKITKRVLQYAQNLIAVGAFGIGTNQIDLETCTAMGIVVFNSQGGSTRSVAELVLANVFALARRIGDSNNLMHNKRWVKTSTGSHTIHGKTLGIVGYGKIGSTAGMMAESLGMNVVYYDAFPMRPKGNARMMPSVVDVLSRSDFITLHVPATKDTDGMIGAEQLAACKKGACIINTSRGSVIHLPSLVSSIRSGHLGGAAIDVFTNEPSTNDASFESIVQGVPNVILTPHVGGSTEEAQEAIGEEVATKLVGYVNMAGTHGSVNMANVEGSRHPENEHVFRLVNVHKNVPGVLKVVYVYLGSFSYLIADVELRSPTELESLHARLCSIPEVVRTRVLHWIPSERSRTPSIREGETEADEPASE